LIQYRKEIDGLRAVAILPVLFFHAGLFGVTGGYVGVDVFFVISGYLITSIILSDVEQKKFSIITFYERRARRIIPALTTVLIASTIAAIIFLPEGLLRDYAESLISVATFTSNFFFYFTNDYFSTAADEKLLLHTWSLAVEEQYYVFFPVFVAIFARLGKPRLSLLIGIMTLVSFAFCIVLLKNQYFEANFYLITSRAWELFIGSLIAFIPIHQIQKKPIANEVGALTGLFLILFSSFYYTDHTPFPSQYALLPTVGAALIILFANQVTIAGRLLSTKLLVGIGLISYSLYLWHQPIFAIVRIKTIGEPTSLVFILLISISCALAFLSWKYVEAPFRNKRRVTKKQIFVVTGFALSLLLVLGTVGIVKEGLPGRFPPNPLEATIQSSPFREECHTRGTDYLKPEQGCRYSANTVTWAAFGDSHLAEITYALATGLKHKSDGIHHLTFSGCGPALTIESRIKGCSEWIKESLTYLEQDKSLKNITIGFRHTKYLFGDQLGTYPENPDDHPNTFFFMKDMTRKEARKAYWHSFNSIIQRLIDADKNIYIVGPIPELPANIKNLVHPNNIFEKFEPILNIPSTSLDYYLSRNSNALSNLRAVSEQTNINLINTADSLCNNLECFAVHNGDSLYFDDNHLSIIGASLIADKILNKRYASSIEP